MTKNQHYELKKLERQSRLYTRAFQAMVATNIVADDVLALHMYSRLFALEDILAEKLGITQIEIAVKVAENTDRYKNRVEKMADVVLDDADGELKRGIDGFTDLVNDLIEKLEEMENGKNKKQGKRGDGAHKACDGLNN